MRYFFLLLFYTCLFVCHSQSYWIYQEAEEYYEGTNDREQSYEKAFVLYQKAADMGNPLAEYKMAICYMHGYGVKQSDKNALLYAKRAAKQGNADAQALLGFYYYFGVGCQRSYRKSTYWDFKAADQGNKTAIYNLQQLGLYRKISYVMDN